MPEFPLRNYGARFRKSDIYVSKLQACHKQINIFLKNNTRLSTLLLWYKPTLFSTKYAQFLSVFKFVDNFSVVDIYYVKQDSKDLNPNPLTNAS